VRNKLAHTKLHNLTYRKYNQELAAFKIVLEMKLS